MRKNFGSKHWLFPQPVLMIATYNEDGTPDIMNAAWGGISDSDEISISISSSHKTAENLLKRGAFTVSFATVDQVAACDYVGLVSGNKVPDKFARAGFHAVKSEFVFFCRSFLDFHLSETNEGRESLHGSALESDYFSRNFLVACSGYVGIKVL